MKEKEHYKVVIRLKQVGSAPILKQQVFKLSSANTFQKVIQYIKKELQQSVYVYVNSAFCPSPDDLLFDLDQMFGLEGTLIVNYSTTPAWG
ncbi:hypothetical protein HDV01_004652 [Terramyces sp. JEL0728]|nr:hypothetical protein HDV01_004652 [Terramyces sp. JEL0728]